jgi:hypothetical protein
MWIRIRHYAGTVVFERERDRERDREKEGKKVK